MKYHRRQVLRGGGVTLGLPFLPSLLPRPAFGADPVPSRKFFVALTSEHGAVKGPSFCPPDSMLDQATRMYDGHDVRHGALAPTRAGSEHRLSEVLRGPANVFTDRLIAKMNVLRGFDLGYYIGHHSGGHLGNFARADQGPVQPATPTIDQVMAWSTSFYRTLDGIKARALVTGQDFRGISFSHADPMRKSGGIQKLAVERSPRILFDKLIAGGVTSPDATPGRPAIVDRVLANYKRLRESNRRLSRDDRARLDAHLTRLAELERRLAAGPGCRDTTLPTAVTVRGDPRHVGKEHFSALNDVVAAAFACGASRIATICIIATFHEYRGNWHQDIAHNHEAAGPQRTLVTSHQRTFEFVVLDLAAKLDAIEDAPGVSLLDNTLLQWTQEAGPATHEALWMPVVTFGSAAGFFRTGRYVDYRNRAKMAERYGEYPGVLYRQWLGTALQAMGIPRNEYESGQPGYGSYRMTPAHQAKVVPDVLRRSGDVLPVIAAG